VLQFAAVYYCICIYSAKMLDFRMYYHSFKRRSKFRFSSSSRPPKTSNNRFHCNTFRNVEQTFACIPFRQKFLLFTETLSLSNFQILHQILQARVGLYQRLFSMLQAILLKQTTPKQIAMKIILATKKMK